jgi:hypothetical protein
VLSLGVIRNGEVVALITNKRRKYAAFYDWHDKQIKELGIVKDFVESVAAYGIQLKDPHLQEPDPPDCVCVDAAGKFVALEVVELVSQEAVERNEQGEKVYRWWEPDNIRGEIAKLLSRKDTKRFYGGPYADIGVLIHTDEPVLNANETRDALAGIAFGPFDQLTRAFLMFTYMPGKGREILQLSVAAHNKALERTRDG